MPRIKTQGTSLSEKTVMDTVVALESFIYGSAYDVHAPADIFAVPEVSNELKMPGGRETMKAVDTPYL